MTNYENFDQVNKSYGSFIEKITTVIGNLVQFETLYAWCPLKGHTYFKLQVCSSMYAFLMDARRQRVQTKDIKGNSSQECLMRKHRHKRQTSFSRGISEASSI